MLTTVNRRRMLTTANREEDTDINKDIDRRRMLTTTSIEGDADDSKGMDITATMKR
jgi:hypothetical protein